MKKLISLLAITTGFYVSGALAQDPPPSIQELRAVEVRYFGGITGFDQAGYRTLKSAIGGMVADGTLAHFETTAVGMEGGSSFCVELSGDPALKINLVTDVLDTIKPSAITIYNYDLKLSCKN